MIELRDSVLVFWFPEVHPDAVLSIDFQRTLRIPDDGKAYSLPPGLGLFPLRHIDDFSDTIPSPWLEHGGVMLPMYQSEALWLHFRSAGKQIWQRYPFIVKVAAGKINAVTGETWADRVNRDPQDYLVAPDQPWLDGYCVEKGFIRQFVAMPLGSGYTAEEQITGKADHGGVQIVVYPMKAEAYERLCARHKRSKVFPESVCYSIAEPAMEMGLAPGGRMRQEIYEDPYDFTDWDIEHRSRCFVHIANSIAWRAITGDVPPTLPPTAEQYNRAGLPWFEYYNADLDVLDGAENLKGLQSVATLSQEKGDSVLPENKSLNEKLVVRIKAMKRKVREGVF